MRKSLIAALLVLGAAASSANLVFAAADEGTSGIEGMKLMNAQMAKELKSRASRLGTSTGSGTALDTLWVGYTPSAVNASNYWGVYAGYGKDGFNRPVNGVAHKGLWDWEQPIHGDSLQGWWPVLNMYASTGGQTRTDYNRPWWALDIGNTANYRINASTGRTFGVVGVWHRDPGSGLAAPVLPVNLRNPGFIPAQGNYAAWMGLRAHGDNSQVDPRTGNPFNEDVLQYVGLASTSGGGNDQGFPGYGSQMDQMLYRDIDFAGNKTANLTIRFKFRTVLSTGATFTANARIGWYDSDPIGVVSGLSNRQPNNFISSSDAGDPLAPRDSFMVYIGSGVENNDWTPAARSLGQIDQTTVPRPVYDKQRRWFGEVLHWDRNSNSPGVPLYYRELLSVSGVWPAGGDSTAPSAGSYVDTTYVIANSVLQPMLTKNNKIRLVFRVKTNRGFDDMGTSFTSNTRGAAVVDRVSYQLTGGSEVVFGDFENAADINNDVNVLPTAAWKSTGKPPGIFFHTHLFSDLTYDDLCGQKGDISRQCNMSGVVLSAGDHDQGEAAGGTVGGTGQRERNDGAVSPVIQLRSTGPGANRHGILPGVGGQGDGDASEDYYIFYDIYTAVMDPFTKGNFWRYACMAYPGNAKAALGGYPAWGQLRYPPFIIFNPDPQCLQDIEGIAANGMLRTSNGNGIPDSVQVFIGKTQQCFRFGVSAGCAPIDGCYFDNFSFALIDGIPAQLTAQIWDWINDAFPRTDPSINPSGPAPGTANFDTTGAEIGTGLNIAQSTLSTGRYDVPGDTVIISSSGNTARVDMIFRILPGPGNYEPVGRPDLGGIVRRPDSRALVTKGDGSFWDQYRQAPGDFASPNAIALHHNAVGGWDANVWNSARCDTAEVNLFARQAPGSANVLGGPADPALWMSAYHESDPKFNTLGITRKRCFVTTPTAAATSVQCDTVPAYISGRPEHADVTSTTKEFTKIIPDYLLTPGSHVEYFFRDQKNSAVPGTNDGMCPDTTIVLQVAQEGSTDGHRWQEFSVLPNTWKKTAYRHPVTQLFGTGPACMLVVDNNDRRGNERVWMSVADTIGSVPQRYWGAHNGWHARGAGADIDDPAQNINGKTGLAGFVSEHIGQPGSGTAWDMYQVKASESLNTSAGSLGSRFAATAGTAANDIVISKRSFQGPTPEMLSAYYKMMLWLSGDLNSGVLGPFADKSQNDVAVITSWLDDASTTSVDRGFYAIGDGFTESNIFEFPPNGQDVLMLSYLGTDLEHNNYIQYSGNTDDLAQLRLFPGWQGKGAGQVQVFGMRNLCLWTNDVLKLGGASLPTLGTITSQYERKGTGGFVGAAGVYKKWDSSSPYVTLVDGWDIEHITSPRDVNTLDRNGYFYKIFLNVWRTLCQIHGTPIDPNIVGVNDVSEMVDFVNLKNNPLARGQATINFGLSKADRVQVQIYDVGGRLVRTLADRQFPAGNHNLTWDGVDNAGRQVARGVYFTQVKYQNVKFVANRKLTVLK